MLSAGALVALLVVAVMAVDGASSRADDAVASCIKDPSPPSCANYRYSTGVSETAHSP